LLGAPERFLPHAVGKWFSPLRDFLAGSEFTLDIANTYTVCLRRVRDRILIDDVLARWYTNSAIQAITSVILPRPNASQISALPTASV
jgi:hypothetical protein